MYGVIRKKTHDLKAPDAREERAWDNAFIVRRVVRWVNAVRKGKPDRRVINILAEFVPGGSIGPAWKW